MYNITSIYISIVIYYV